MPPTVPKIYTGPGQGLGLIAKLLSAKQEGAGSARELWPAMQDYWAGVHRPNSFIPLYYSGGDDSATMLAGGQMDVVNGLGPMRRADRLRFVPMFIRDDPGKDRKISDVFDPSGQKSFAVLRVPDPEKPPEGLINLQLPKSLRGQGAGTDLLGGLLSLREDPNEPFSIYDVTRAGKPFWTSHGAGLKPPSARDNPNDYQVSPLEFLQKTMGVPYARGGRVY